MLVTGQRIRLAAAGGALLLLPTTAVALAADDTTPPFIFAITSGTLGDNGWYVSDVDVTWSVSDGQSEITSTQGCAPVSVVADQPATDYTCSATSAGGSASFTVSIKRDATAPVVELVGGPVDGATYAAGEVPPVPTCTASDATSGLAGACTVSGYATMPGTHTVSATATDHAGNVGVASHTYEVVQQTYDLVGFHAPLRMGVVNEVKAGRTVPLKFDVFDGDTEVTTTDVVSSVVAQRVSCTSGVPLDWTGEPSVHWAGGQFVAPWQTPRTPGACFEVRATTVDGSAITADVHLR